MTAGDEENSLVERARRGELNAFGVLVGRYQSRVRGYCSTVLLDKSLAEDAAQEVFLKAFQNIEQFRGYSRFSTWLYQIAVNHCRDLLRKSEVRGSRVTQSWDSLSAGEQDRASANADRRLPNSAVEDRDLITKLLDGVSSDYREVLVLREAHDLSYEQIAETLRCSLDAVKARLRRARAEIFARSEQMFDGGGISVRGSAREKRAAGKAGRGGERIL